MEMVAMNDSEVKLLHKIKNSKEFDESIIKAIKNIKKSGTKRIQDMKWNIKDNLILFCRKIYIPKNNEL